MLYVKASEDGVYECSSHLLVFLYPSNNPILTPKLRWKIRLMKNKNEKRIPRLP